mmetsp:Transcript_54182/g.150750  ORF Transcript_54182/g.150750 Transcript_54182/m.150750 type:complete len:298 (+) Transcript_54182:70-963(+)
MVPLRFVQTQTQANPARKPAFRACMAARAPAQSPCRKLAQFRFRASVRRSSIRVVPTRSSENNSSHRRCGPGPHTRRHRQAANAAGEPRESSEAPRGGTKRPQPRLCRTHRGCMSGRPNRKEPRRTPPLLRHRSRRGANSGAPWSSKRRKSVEPLSWGQVGPKAPQPPRRASLPRDLPAPSHCQVLTPGATSPWRTLPTRMPRRRPNPKAPRHVREAGLLNSMTQREATLVGLPVICTRFSPTHRTVDSAKPSSWPRPAALAAYKPKGNPCHNRPCPRHLGAEAATPTSQARRNAGV